MAKRNKYARRRRSGQFSFLYRLLCFVLITAAGAVALTLFFKVDTVEVTGQVRYTEAQVAEASGVERGDNLFLMDKNKVVANITTALPYVETVRIRRMIPDTLRIYVTECTAPVAVRSAESVWLLSGQGKIVEKVAPSFWEAYPQIIGVTPSEPAVGAPLAVAEGQEYALDALLSLLPLLEKKGMLPQVQALYLDDPALLTMRYMDRFNVVLRYNADFDYKLDYLLAVVQRLEANESGVIDMTQEGKVSFIPR